MRNETTGELRRKIEELTHSIPYPNSPASDLEEAENALKNLTSAARLSNANAVKVFDAGQTEMEAEIGPEFRATEYFLDLLREAGAAGVEEQRVALARDLADVAEKARTRGMWIEYLLIRSLTWVVAEPTGIAAVALRQQMYVDPVTIPLLVEFHRGDCGPIGAATDLASAARNLSRAIRERTRAANNEPTN